MALDRLTKVDGGGISTTSDYRVGIITASKFVGPFDGTGGNFSGVVTATNGVFSGNISAVDGTFTGNVSIGGTLTYEDVTNIDSVGIITAQTDVHVGAGLSVVGVSTLTGRIFAGGTVIPGYSGADDLTIGTESGNHGITIRSSTTGGGGLFFSDATSAGDNSTQWAGGLEYSHSNGQLRFYQGGTVRGMFQGSGHFTPWIDSTGALGTTSKRWSNVHADAATIAGDIDVDGHTNLDNVSVAGVSTFSGIVAAGVGSTAITLSNSHKITLGSAHELEMFHDGSNSYIKQRFFAYPSSLNIISENSNINIMSGSGGNMHGGYENAITCQNNGPVKLYWGGTLAYETTGYGGKVVGSLLINMGQLRIEDEIRHEGDSDTKIRFPANDTVSVETAGSQRLRITSTGEVNIGGNYTQTTAPLCVTTDANSFGIRLQTGSNSVCDILNNDAAGSCEIRGYYNNNSGTQGEGFRIESNGETFFRPGGNAGLNITSNGNVVVSQTLFITDRIQHYGDNDTTIRFPADDTISFETSGDERARISSVGHLGVGDNNPDTRLSVKAASGTDVVGKFTSTDANAWIQFRDNTTTDTAVMVGANGNNLLFRAGSNTRWKIDSSGHFVPNSPGSYNIGSTSLEIGDIYLGVNKKVFCGLNQELQLFSDGTDGYLKETNGDLYLQSTADDVIIRAADNISIQAQGGEYCINGNGNGSVDLYYDGGTYTTPKLSTTATGITVDGEVKASQEYPLTKPVLDFNFAAEKKLDPRIQFTRESIATFVDKKGIVRYSSENQPRFDHHPTSGVSLGLLLEKQSINYQEYSTLMSEANSINNLTITDNFTTSPDGTQNASKLVNAGSSNTGTNIGWSATSVASNSYAMWSIWVKSEETSCILQFYSNTYIFGNDRVNIELADGTYGGTSASGTFRFNIEKYPNKWWRISVGGNGANAGGGWYIGVVDSKTAARGATCGSATNKTWFAWGVQEEIGTQRKFATSYIPTNGASVTRAADRGTIDGDDFDDFFDRYQGAVVHETSNAIQSWTGGGSGWEFNNDNYQYNAITNISSGYSHNGYPGGYAVAHGESSDTGTNSMAQFGPNSATGNQPFNNGYYAGRTPNNSNVDYNRLYKTYTDGMSWDVTGSTNTLTSAVGGFSATGTNTHVISYRNISKLEFGSDATDMDGSYQKFSGRIKRWMYYDKALTATQLENLTAQDPVTYL